MFGWFDYLLIFLFKQMFVFRVSGLYVKRVWVTCVCVCISHNM